LRISALSSSSIAISSAPQLFDKKSYNFLHNMSLLIHTRIKTLLIFVIETFSTNRKLLKQVNLVHGIRAMKTGGMLHYHEAVPEAVESRPVERVMAAARDEGGMWRLSS